MRGAVDQQTPPPPGDSIEDALNVQLATNFPFAALSTALFTPVVVIGVGSLFGWHFRLAIWAVLMALVAVFQHALCRLAPTYPRWRLAVAGAQATSGFAWASSIVLVVPDGTVELAVTVAALLGVLSSSVPFAAAVRSAALSFVGSMTVFATLFLVLSAPGELRVLASVFGFSGLFYAALVSVVHRSLRETTELSNELARSAATDPLTGVLNRRAFWTALQQEIEAGSQATVAFLDLDGFKPVNDEYGHGVGDEVLIGVADRLALVSSSAVVGRVGGDEFVLFDTRQSDLHAFGQHLLAQFEEGFDIEGVLHQVGCSVGVADISARASSSRDLVDGASIAAELVKRADAAQYRAKRAGGHRVEIDSTDLNRSSPDADNY